jgi:flagellar FliJ protein
VGEVARPFKLEAVLTHRQHQEESARKVFADAARELSRARQVLTDMEKVRAQYRRAMRLKQDNNGSAMELILYTRYLARLASEINEQQHTIETLAANKEEKRMVLMTALKDRKVIEKLKERYLADEEKKERDMEQKLVNDVAISRYQRKQ